MIFHYFSFEFFFFVLCLSFCACLIIFFLRNERSTSFVSFSLFFFEFLYNTDISATFFFTYIIYYITLPLIFSSHFPFRAPSLPNPSLFFSLPSLSSLVAYVFVLLFISHPALLSYSYNRNLFFFFIGPLSFHLSSSAFHVSLPVALL